MERTMRFGVITEPHHAEVRERPLPALKDNEVLLKLMSCNICTTDYGLWTGARNQPTPMAGGHENAGIVLEKGSQVGDELQIGDHVGILAYEHCGQCPECRMGRTLRCPNVSDDWELSEDGYWGSFGFANYAIIEARYAIKFNSELPFEEMGFLENLSTVVHGIRMLDVRAGHKVVVIGAGTMGLLNAMTARAYGARVIVSDVDEKKLRCAKELGFTELVNPTQGDPAEQVDAYLNGTPVDMVIVAVGVTAANDQALAIAKSDAKILFFAAGYPAPELRIDSNAIHYRRLQLIGTFGADASDFQIAADLLDTGKVPVSKLIEAHFPLSQIQQAYELAATPGSYRVAVHMWDGDRAL